MATFVLVPGAWLGGWAWEPTAGRLRERGHDVHPVTLTGLGERAHLAAPDVDLETHVADVVDLVRDRDLHDVVLLGHSYAGIVVTGAADRIPERLAKVVYLESGPVPDGVSYLDMEEPAAKERDERQVAETGDGWRLAMPSWEELERVNGASLEGLGGAERNWIRDHATDQPFATYTQPLRLRGTQAEPLPKVLISSSFPLDQVRELIKAGHPWFAPLAGPEWQLLELRTGHWPLASRPGDLADLLDQRVA
ncbi:MAG TPA: alpha/beta hydrolase [Actinomycetes bacterium]|nr:alpha/beta hydrolase [Actinomycetes bacterium]